MFFDLRRSAGALPDVTASWLLWVRDISTWLAVALTIYSGAIYLVNAMPGSASQASRD